MQLELACSQSVVHMVSAVSITCLCTSSICVAMVYDTILYFAFSYIVMVFES